MVSKNSQASAAPEQPVLANGERHYKVTANDLPLSCPMPDVPVWNSHPRIYLPIEENGGAAQCNYCGAHFELIPESAAKRA